MAWLRGTDLDQGRLWAVEQRLALRDTIAFDKTGTLTKGQPRLASLMAVAGREENDVLRLAASVEQASQHPLASPWLRPRNSMVLT